MGAKNKVIAGDYEGFIVDSVFGQAYFTKLFAKIDLNKNNVESFELITDEHRKSAVSGISRGLVGGVLLGPVGLLAGLTGKTKDIYVLAIMFKDGKKSLIEVDKKRYEAIMKGCF